MPEEIRIQETTTKNEVFAAYDELLRKLKNTQKSTKQDEKIVEEKKAVVETAIKESGDDLGKHLFSLKSALNKSLEDIELKLLAEQRKFVTLQQAVDIQNKELLELYEIRKNADSLAALMQAISQKKALWEKEQKDYDTTRRDKHSQLEKERQREEETYIYNRDLTRRKEESDFDEKMRRAELALEEKRLQQEDKFREREDKILARERDFQFQFDTAKRDLEQEILTRRSEIEEAFNQREQEFASRETDIAKRDRESQHRSELAVRALELELATMRAEAEEGFKNREAELEAERREMERQATMALRQMEEEFAKACRATEEALRGRESAITAREHELQKLHEQVANFPEVLRREILEAERIQSDQLAVKFQYETKILQKEFEAERKVLKTEIAALNDKLEQVEANNYSFKPLAYATPTVEDARKKKAKIQETESETE